MKNEALRQAVDRRRDELKAERQSWESHWQDVVDYILPWHGRYLNDTDNPSNRGNKKHGKIMDSTAEDAMDILAAGMQSGLTSPARPWFKLGLANNDLEDMPQVKEWLYIVERLMREVFRVSNVYDTLHQGYMELGGFGSAGVLVLEDYDTVIRCMPLTIGQFWYATDPRGRVNTMYRRDRMTAVNMVEEFGEENCSESVKSAMKSKQTEKGFYVWQAIEKNDDRVPKSVTQLPYRSVYWEDGTGDSESVLKIEGFRTFPVMGPRWAVVGGNVYGYSPGMKVLADVKMLQKMQEKSLKGIDLMIDPPIKAPGSMKTAKTPINTLPGGVSFYNEAEGGKDSFGALYDVRPDIQANEFKIERVQAAIRRGLYNDLFLMLSSSPTMQRKQMTATEVAERHEEKLLMLGPVLERLHNELLNPLIDRTFDIMAANDMLPPAPEEMQGAEIKVEYISLLAQAMKMVSLTGIQQFTSFIGNLSAVVPEALDRFNHDEAIEEYADGAGVPPRLVRSLEEAQNMRAARAEQAQAMQQTEMMGQMAQGAKVLSEADMGGNNALNALTGAPQ